MRPLKPGLAPIDCPSLFTARRRQILSVSTSFFMSKKGGTSYRQYLLSEASGWEKTEAPFIIPVARQVERQRHSNSLPVS